ncbi:similar to talin [Rhodopirellula baltica SH 1]|uniref:Similar to talin n=1 Tax=Rhodopirellula baltica (strain DSM 10527 / NCIMB 13988 / SH1) TaxID=243090 RepID=Q7ULL5_RHOBA|nr:similar to talin [Rhodopirellula baltica SH 1]
MNLIGVLQITLSRERNDRQIADRAGSNRNIGWLQVPQTELRHIAKVPIAVEHQFRGHRISDLDIVDVSNLAGPTWVGQAIGCSQCPQNIRRSIRDLTSVQCIPQTIAIRSEGLHHFGAVTECHQHRRLRIRHRVDAIADLTTRLFKPTATALPCSFSVSCGSLHAGRSIQQKHHPAQRIRFASDAWSEQSERGQ